MNTLLKIILTISYGGIFYLLSVGELASARTEKIKIAKFQIEALEESILILKKNIGRFPTTIEGLSILLENPKDIDNWRGPYMNRPFLYIDPWENNYIYLYPAQYGSDEYDLYSIGPNGIDEHGLGDDITNWKK